MPLYRLRTVVPLSAVVLLLSCSSPNKTTAAGNDVNAGGSNSHSNDNHNATPDYPMGLFGQIIVSDDPSDPNQECWEANRVFGAEIDCTDCDFAFQIDELDDVDAEGGLCDRLQLAGRVVEFRAPSEGRTSNPWEVWLDDSLVNYAAYDVYTSEDASGQYPQIYHITLQSATATAIPTSHTRLLYHVDVYVSQYEFVTRNWAAYLD